MSGGIAGPYVVGWFTGAGFDIGGAVASIASVMMPSGLVVVWDRKKGQ